MVNRPLVHWRRNISPRNTHRDNNPPRGVVPDNILAFRTITTILSHLQQEQPFIFLAQSPSAEERQALKVSNALATVAITHHEVIAVATKRIDPLNLAVTACAQLADESPTTPSDSKPTISNVEAPANLQINDVVELDKYLEKRWSNSSLPTHLYILKRVLVMRDEGTKQTVIAKLSKRLQRYVIATCYPKMLFRLKKTALSQSYIATLKLVTNIQFDESLQEQGSKAEITHDWLFLTKFLLPATNVNSINTDIPNILEQAKLAAQNKPFQLYTRDTCTEFHALLLELLERFQTSLERLSDSRGAGTEPAEGSAEFKTALAAVLLAGYALQNIAKGIALRIHLKTISAKLTGRYREPKAEGDDEQQGEHDDALEEVRPFVSVNGVLVPLWQSYRDWLRLMVVHFDAVEILVRYVTDSHFEKCDISLQILAAPPVDKGLLPWEKLFNNPTLFPAGNAMDPRLSKTDNQIYEFLRRATDDPLKTKDLNSFVIVAMNSWKASRDVAKSDPQDLETVKLNISKLQKSIIPGWADCAHKLLISLDEWQQHPSDALARDITITLQSLVDSGKLFSTLSDLSVPHKKEGLPDQSPRKEFKGTLHCEACLASLLDYVAKDITIDSKCEKELAELKGFGRVIGVSKCCCPACRHFLELLTKGTNQQLLVRGAHNTVTACTLPTWVPAHIVDSMNAIFWVWLRQEVINLMGRSELMRNRVQSTGSQRLSSDSSQEGREGIGGELISPDTFHEAGWIQPL